MMIKVMKFEQLNSKS